MWFRHLIHSFSDFFERSKTWKCCEAAFKQELQIIKYLLHIYANNDNIVFETTDMTAFI